jgi:hypothetical protein
MPGSSKRRSKRRSKNPVVNFFNRLTGRKYYKKHHRSHFPGINLPEDYEPVTWQEKKKKEMKTHSPDSDESVTKATSESSPPIESDIQSKITAPTPSETTKSKPTRKRRSIFASLDYYLQQRKIKRDKKRKEKLRKRHRKESRREYRRLNKGPGLRKRLFTWSEGVAEFDKGKKVPLLSQRNPFYRNLTIVTNSIMIFLVTYILTYLFYWLTCMLVASFYGLDSILYFYDLKFNDHSPLWNRFNILMVTGIPPFFCLFLGLFLYRVIFKIKRFTGLQKLFILWSAFHLFNHFFGAFPSGIVTDEGFGYVAAWLYMNTAFKFLFSLVSLFALGLIGYHSAKHILETSDSHHRIKGSNKLPFMFYQFAIPWFMGTLIMMLLRIPENFNYPYETLMLFSTAFIVIPPFFNEKAKPELNLLKVKKKRHINTGYLAMMLILIAFLRIMLGIGLHFIIEISISISPAST